MKNHCQRRGAKTPRAANFSSGVFYALVVLGLSGLVSPAFAGEGTASLGAQFDTWTSNYIVPYNGWEILAPLSVAYKVDSDLSFWGQTEFANGNYTDSVNGTETLNLSALSDTVLGGELRFKSFSFASSLNVGLNLPTGDPTWEAKQVSANIPTEFMDTRYRGRGFGVNVVYGLAIPWEGGDFGAAAGYVYSGAFNPGYGINVPSASLETGDSIFFSLSHARSWNTDQTEIIRLSSYLSTPVKNNGQNIYQLGTNFNASYGLMNPKALSFELGAQLWLPGEGADTNGNLSPEAHPYEGMRFYLNPSYAMGNLNLAAQFKYILPNGYAINDPSFLYDGGGYLAGFHPSYLWKLDEMSDLKFMASYDYILYSNGGFDVNNNRADVIYGLWTFGATYEIKL